MSPSVPASAPTTAVCSECGVAIRPGSHRCWLCGRSAALAHLPGRGLPRLTRNDFRFQLHSLFLTMALVAVCLAVARHWPYLTMALIVPLATAYLRTLQISCEQGAVGRPLGGFAKIVCYARSLVVTLAILVGALAAMVVSIGLFVGAGALVGHWRDEPMYTLVGFAAGTSLGVFGALAVAAFTGYRFWPNPHRRQATGE